MRGSDGRRGFTTIEILVAVAIVAALLAIALPAFAALRDRSSVRGATADLVSVLAGARHAAIATGRVVAVRLDTASATVRVHAPPDTLAVHPLRAVHGVRMHATRDSIAYAPTGLGHGAATTTIRLTRGRAEDTVVVARTGRVRH